MTSELYLAYLATIAIFFATPPGPSQILMISNSMHHGMRRSLATAAGDLTANACQMTAAAFGLAAILATTHGALQVVKWAGVVYLIYIGMRTFLALPKAMVGGAQGSSSNLIGLRKLYFQGFFTSAANPKAVFFFAALFPQFVDPGLAIGPQLVILGATYIVVDGTLLALYGAIAERAASGIRMGAAKLLNRVTGAMMICAAIVLGWRDIDVSTLAEKAE